jgi:two-component system, NarL family, sensor histidine kinase UhpB
MTLVVIGLALVVLVLALALVRERRRLRPLEDLVEAMEKVDLSSPRPLLPASIDGVGETEEVERIELAFLRMMRRLEAERRRAGSAALHAQEEERARVARDLHDEVNQSLTGLLLRLEAARERAPAELAHELAETRALANQAMQELLTLARALRPTALDDLGLRAALGALVDELGRKSGIETSFAGTGELADVPMDTQLVAYRVAQEALSNAAQHSHAERIDVRLDRDAEGVELSVADDGRGFTFDQAARGLGIGGMRERALLVGGDLGVTSRPDEGTRVSLKLPIRESDGNDAGGAWPRH